MKHRLGLSVTLVLCATAEAADLPAPSTQTPAATVPLARPTPSKPLDLRVGDIRKYMLPHEYREAINAPDPDKSAIVVEGTRYLLPMESMQPIPGGIFGLWYAAKHPTKAWRLLVPDLNAPPDGPPVDKVPPPIFRWGP
jgi:hypothetical protein